MKEKGFTLIELLAVIVILAIIALIATPVILNIIDNTRTSTTEQSLNLYGKAVENAIAKKLLNDTTYTVKAGKYYVSDNGKCLKLEADTDGECIIEVEYDGSLSGVNLSSIRINSNGKVEKINYTSGTQATPSTDTICVAANSSESGSTAIGTQYNCQLNESTYYDFYVLSTNGDNVNLLMSENLYDYQSFYTSVESDGAATDYDLGLDIKPTVLTTAESLISIWTNLSDYSESYTDKSGFYTTTLKQVRLPKYDEIAALCDGVGESSLVDTWDNRDDEGNIIEGCTSGDCTETQPYKYGCPTWITSGDETYYMTDGYWTLDYDSLESSAWGVSTYYKTLDDFSYDWFRSKSFGIRPVITVTTSDLG